MSSFALQEKVMSRLTHWLPGLLLLTVITGPLQIAAAAEDISVAVGAHLKQGKFAASEAFLQERLAAEPRHSQAQFALGIVKVMSAVEKLGQDQYRYGALTGNIRNLPVLRLPVPANPDPQKVTYQQIRQILADFQNRLVQAEAEMAKVDLKQDFKLPLDLMTIRFDFNGDGKSDDQESFSSLFGTINRQRAGAAVPRLYVSLDAGDVLWLRGYCHFLAGFCDVVLAYDHQRLFNHTGQLIYPQHVSSEPTAEPLDLSPRQDWTWHIADLIAAIHLMNFPVKEPKRMESARQHLLEMIRTSRQSWVLIQAETDNDHEWLPNPNQTGVLRIPVTRELIDGWHAVLTEMEDLIEGRKLIPYWRDYVTFTGNDQPIKAEGRGINLKRFFAEPRDFDLILIIQGTGVLPYVEKGKLSRPETWDNLTRVFGGQFFGFAAWFN
jgi:hypothetical protein